MGHFRVGRHPAGGRASGPRVAVRGRMAWGVLPLVGLLWLVQGCAVYDFLYGKPPRRTAQQSDQELMRSAEQQLQRGRYDDARQDYQRLMNQYPDSDLVAMARLGTARALYQDKKYDEARTEYQRFLELHPQNERADEAHYYLGMAYVRSADAPDRDQTYTRRGLEEFELLVRQMPDSQYVPDARAQIVTARRKLAEKELYVGRFYYDRSNYAAAVGRFKSVLAHGNATGLEDQALYFLGDSLWQLEQKEEARVAFRQLVQDYSQSEWAPAAASRIDTPLVRVGPPMPTGPGIFARMGQALRETWNELGDTVKSYRLFQ